MFNISSCINELRASNAPQGHVVIPFLGHFVGPVIATLELELTPAFRAWNLAVSLVEGDLDAIRPGYLLEFLTADGEHKGFWNVRETGIVMLETVGVLPIRELNRADIDIAAGDLIKVHAYVPLVDTLPASDASFAPGQEDYTDQTEAFPPIACDYGHFFGFIPEGETVAQVPASALKSFVVDSESGGSRAFVWTVLAGTLDFASGSGSTDASPTFEGGAGESTVLLEVTDSSNGKTYWKYMYVRIYSEDDPPIDLAVPFDLRGMERDGWSTDVTIYQNVPRTLLPDGVLLCVFVRQWINGVEQSFGGETGREHMKLVGYASQETIRLAPAGELTFTIVSPLQRMMSLPGWGKAFIHKLLATNWQEMENLTVFRILVELARRGSTFPQIFNLRFTDSASALLYPKAYAAKASPGAQLLDFSESVNARVVGLRSGEIQIHTHPALMDKDARAAANIHQLAIQDMLIGQGLDPQITRQHFDVVELLRLSGITAGLTGNESVSSDYPGRATGRGNQTITYDKAIVPATNAQQVNNKIAGLRGARANAVYIDPDETIKERAYEWEASYPGSYDALDFDQQFIAFDDSPENLREIDITRLRHYLQRINVRYEETGTATVTHGYMAETYAPPGEKSPQQDNGDNGLGGITPIPDFWTPPSFLPPTYGLRKGQQRMGLILTTGIALTEDWDTPAVAGGPSWLFNDTTDLSLPASIQDGISDPFSPLYITQSGDVVLFTTHDQDICKIEIAADGSMSAASVYTFAYARTILGERVIEMLFQQGNIVVVSYNTAGDRQGVYYLRSLDNGDNWSSETALTTNYNTSAIYLNPGLAPAGAGTFRTSVITGASGDAPAMQGRVTANGAGSWSTDAAIAGVGLAGCIHVPVHNNPGAALKFHGDMNWNGGSSINRTLLNGVDVSPIRSGVKYGPQFNRAIDSCPVNRDRIAVCGRARDDATSPFEDPSAVFVSRSGGSASSSWTPITPDALADNAYFVVRWLGNDPDAFLLGGQGAGMVAQTLDFGTTIENKAGNLPAQTNGRVINFFGW